MRCAPGWLGSFQDSDGGDGRHCLSPLCNRVGEMLAAIEKAKGTRGIGPAEESRFIQETG
jgi:hypothetical protein